MNDGNMVYITVSKAELLNKYVEIINNTAAINIIKNIAFNSDFLLFF